MVKLSDVASELALVTDEMTFYLHRDTGDMIPIADSDLQAVEQGKEDALMFADDEMIPVIKRVLTSDEYVAAPSKYAIHEWDIMKRFAQSVDDQDAAEELLDAIHGSGAFRLFNKTIDRLGLRKDWYAFRDKALENIAREWLEAEGIPYV